MIVIGAGSGGLNIAMFLNRVGLKVLLVDKSDKNIGGDCLNYGCVPSKALIHAARLLNDKGLAQKFGLRCNGTVDLKKVMVHVKERQSVIRKHENANYFQKIGIDVALGKARFEGKNSISVNKKRYSGKKIVIATGSRPRDLGFDGLTNETIFDLEKLPKKLAVIGGGPIGLELGQAFNRFGSKVTVIQRGSKLLPKECKEITGVLLNRLQSEGIQFIFNSEAESIGKKIKLDDGSRVSYDQVLISAGRILNIEGLDLEKAGIRTKEGKILVDRYLRTTNRDIYLCGDIVGSYQFTHAAELHASVILNNLFSPFRKKISYDNLSWVTYTSPEIATFGLNEERLKLRNIKYHKLVHDLKEDDRAIIEDKRYGKLILYIDKKRILGGTMIADDAGEMIQELILANSTGMPYKRIFEKIYPYPTRSRVNKRIFTEYLAKKLTGRNKKILRMLYH